LLVEEFECHRDEAEEGIDKHSVHVDDAMRVLKRIECTILAVARLPSLLHAVKSGTSSTLLGNG
jgi:hypothetical protein